ncbi:GCN5-related N-acetyltransferase [Kribbella flavida DSM 17836]|uniref:GCN5-related N-acetyltransferase n=1 Tax=Kribbella flavida (strain DSM 17836 / JCM 10339 / NBRC 14399) TaxID=479435 RepID=D2PMC8_KRIFD|nr:GNAT family N-acetyltransferase [Kribbella flavida]ADB34496.1 GCN5-related N-acetyltransferase [Kribbella flavida DSM 17836]
MHSPTELDRVLQAWVHGWSVSRSTLSPVPAANGYRIDVGLPGHLVRYVLPCFDEQLVDGLREPSTWVKVCGELPELPARWTVEPVEYLMAAPLPLAVPPGPAYGVRTVVDGSLVRATVERDGVVAARGQAALWTEYAVVDQVVTEPAYRRRGLGTVVMRALGEAAAQQGARTGVLVATEDGRALYSRLGWSLISPVGVARLGA